MENGIRKSKGYIYRIHNKETGRSYVGQTKNIKKRWENHRSLLKNNKHHCASLQEDWNSCEKDVFLFQKVLVCERGELTEKEQEAWDREENPYNGRPTNHIYPDVTPETRKKMSIATSGEKHPRFGKFGKDNPISKPVLQYDLKGNFIAKYGSTTEAERKTGASNASISMCCRGKKLKSAGGFVWKYEVGEEIKEKIEIVREPPPCCKPILQYNKEGNFIEEYESAREAERKTGVDNGDISACCRGRHKSAGGFIWKYKEGDNIKEKIEARKPDYNSKPVLQYDKEGNFIAEYESATQAVRELGASLSHISNCCRGKYRHKSAGGFIWRYKIDEEIKRKIKPPTNLLARVPKSVLQYDKEGNLLAEYESIGEAGRKTGVGQSNISACCKGKLKSAGGYIWQYKDQPL